jgi:hypothetical protein
MDLQPLVGKRLDGGANRIVDYIHRNQHMLAAGGHLQQAVPEPSHQFLAENFERINGLFSWRRNVLRLQQHFDLRQEGTVAGREGVVARRPLVEYLVSQALFFREDLQEAYDLPAPAISDQIDSGRYLAEGPRFGDLEGQVNQISDQLERMAESQEFLSRVMTERLDKITDPGLVTPH